MSPPALTSLLAASLLATALTACANPPMDDEFSTFPGDRPNEIQRGAKPPVPRRNPDAVPYDITLRIENAPGPFGKVRAAMVYRVENERCLPRLGGMSGTRVTASEFIAIPLESTGPAQWQGRFQDDLLLDEDYYGLGICRWQLAGVSVEMLATGAAGETSFSEFLFPVDLKSGASTKAYFVQRHYPRAEMSDFPASGERDILKFKPEVRDRLFALVADVRQVRP